MGTNLAAHLRLLLVTDDRLLAERDPVEVARAAERGGVTALQLRLKAASSRELVALGRALVAALRIPVLVNDRPDVARAAGAAGVHLGPDDVPVAVARLVLGPAAVIGASVGGVTEVAGGAGADYWGVGPWRATETKPDAGVALGVAGFRAVVRLAGGAWRWSRGSCGRRTLPPRPGPTGRERVRRRLRRAGLVGGAGAAGRGHRAA